MLEATSIPANFGSELSGMGESLSYELREQGRDFVAILLKGGEAVKQRPVRVECPRNRTHAEYT